MPDDETPRIIDADAQPMPFESAYNEHYENASTVVRVFGLQGSLSDRLASAQIHATLALAEATMELVEIVKSGQAASQSFIGTLVAAEIPDA